MFNFSTTEIFYGQYPRELQRKPLAVLETCLNGKKQTEILSHYIQKFYAFDKDACNQLIKIAWNLPNYEFLKYGVLYLAIKLDLESNPNSLLDLDEISLYCLALNAIFESPPKLDRIRLYKLLEDERSLDFEQIKTMQLTPLELLKTILYRNNKKFPVVNFLKYPRPYIELLPKPNKPIIWNRFAEFDLDKFPIDLIRELDAASLIWCYLFEQDKFVYSSGVIRELYLPGLARELQKQEIHHRLINKLSSKQNDIQIFFDGLAFRNAQGYSFHDIYRIHSIKALFHELPNNLKEEYFYSACESLGENTQYRIGTLWQSMSSVLFKLSYYQTNRKPSAFHDKQQLLYRFKLKIEEWEIARNYPIHPFQLLAMHYAASNNISYTIKSDNAALLEKLKTVLTNAINSSEWLEDADPNNEQLLKTLISKFGNGEIDEYEAKTDFKNFIANFNVSHEMLDPWFSNRANTSLKLKGKALTQESIEAEKKRILVKYHLETIQKGKIDNQITSWLYWIPFLSSLDTLVDGVKNRNWRKTLFGVTSFSIDTWLLVEDESTLLSARPLASLGDRISINVLNSFQAVLPESKPEIPKHIINTHKPPIMNTKIVNSNQISWAQAIKKVYQGDKEQFMTDPLGNKYLLVFLEDEQKVIPVKPQGGSYREVTWLGEVRYNTQLIYKIDNHFARFSLAGGNRLLEKLQKSYTYRELKLFIPLFKSRNSIRHFRQVFNKYIIIENTSAFDAFERVYHLAYQKSALFRVLFDYFIHRMEPFIRKNTFRPIKIKLSLTAHTSYVDHEGNIVINLENDPALTPTYLGEDYYYSGRHTPQTYKGVEFQIERKLIHEILHVFLNIDDLEFAQLELLRKKFNKHGIKEHSVLSMGLPELKRLAKHRESIRNLVKDYEAALIGIKKTEQGIIVSLNERILSDTFEESFPTRLRYYHYVEGEKVKDIERLRERVVAISKFRDELCTDIYSPENLMIRGIPISQSELINKFSDFLAQLEESNFGRTSFIDSFMIRYEIADFDQKNFLMSLYEKSNLFYKIVNKFSAIKDQKYQFNYYPDKDPAGILEPLSQSDNVFCFFKDGTRYLSENGFVPIEWQRWLLYQILKDLTGEDAFALTNHAYSVLDNSLGKEEALISLISDLANQRALAHLVTDQILREAKLTLPKILSGVFTRFDGDLIEKILSKQQVKLVMATSLENEYIEKKLYTSPPWLASKLLCYGASCRKSPIEPYFPVKQNQKDLIPEAGIPRQHFPEFNLHPSILQNNQQHNQTYNLPSVGLLSQLKRAESTYSFDFLWPMMGYVGSGILFIATTVSFLWIRHRQRIKNQRLTAATAAAIIQPLLQTRVAAQAKDIVFFNEEYFFKADNCYRLPTYGFSGGLCVDSSKLLTWWQGDTRVNWATSSKTQRLINNVTLSQNQLHIFHSSGTEILPINTLSTNRDILPLISVWPEKARNQLFAHWRWEQFEQQVFQIGWHTVGSHILLHTPIGDLFKKFGLKIDWRSREDSHLLMRWLTALNHTIYSELFLVSAKRSITASIIDTITLLPSLQNIFVRYTGYKVASAKLLIRFIADCIQFGINPGSILPTIISIYSDSPHLAALGWGIRLLASLYNQKDLVGFYYCMGLIILPQLPALLETFGIPVTRYLHTFLNRLSQVFITQSLCTAINLQTDEEREIQSKVECEQGDKRAQEGFQKGASLMRSLTFFKQAKIPSELIKNDVIIKSQSNIRADLSN